MPELDYYKVLGVSRDASQDEIRKAYRRLSREYHPDMKPNDPEALQKFKQVQEAFDVVGDPEKRKQYDRFGHAAFQGAGAGAGPRGPTYTWTGPGAGAGPIDLGDLFGGGFDFGDLFGGAAGAGGARGRRAVRPRAGADQTLEIEIPFHLAAEGGSHDIQFQRDGRLERLTVKIPAGIDSGNVIRLAGQGQPGVNGGPPGDLLVTVRVAPHPYFRREGNNLLVDVPITFSEAALGAKVDVPTLSEGLVTVTVPPGTSSGAKLRLRGKGIPDRQTHQRGDEFAVIKVVAPKNLNDRGQQLLRELAEVAPQSLRQGIW